MAFRKYSEAVIADRARQELVRSLIAGASPVALLQRRGALVGTAHVEQFGTRYTVVNGCGKFADKVTFVDGGGLELAWFEVALGPGESLEVRL